MAHRSDVFPIPGARDVRATLDGDGESGACVIACPADPTEGGDRHDSRIGTVSDAVQKRDIDCLRFDYGEWDEGRGERTDVENALRWADGRYDRIGLFGYSFGAKLALVVAGENGSVDAVSALAPGSTLRTEDDVVEALDRVECPMQIVYGSRDSAVDWEPVVERLRERDGETVEVDADHFFVSQYGEIGGAVGEFMGTTLRE